ncbi:MerR family transcriptional regulator [Constantimarinum furrinae]|nr:MerR family transcriptional regulator [Constantimarinum furrinae]
MGVKTQFSIKDLENLSNVKAHTIRIWEKRYNLLEPERTDTNIRKYNLENLKKLLNVAYLYDQGHKISKIAKLENSEIQKLIQKNSINETNSLALKQLKSAMFDFDDDLFQYTFTELNKTKSFSEIFSEVFLPLLSDIGLLWQTGTIDPSHERFISELIKRKVIVAIDSLKTQPNKSSSPVFALFLPIGEIHEIGLLFTNFQLLSRGFKTVYLGTNIGIESLVHITNHYNQICFLSYFTVKPDLIEIRKYLRDFNKRISKDDQHQLWLLGAKVRKFSDLKTPPNIKIIANNKDFPELLETLKKS